MSVDHIRYDLLTQEALRGVIRTVLSDAAVKGLPGEHHFFITFDTRAEGVRISPRLKASYPDEMTVVLQHQFWDLTVGEEDFEVGLAFNGIPERLHVPLKAVKAFFDPSVRFGLQFTVEVDGAAAPDEAKAATKPRTPALAGKKLGPQPSAEATAETKTGTKTGPEPNTDPKTDPKKATKPPRGAVESGKAPVQPLPTPAKDEAAPGGEVVRLDRFRKK
jgi:hypothetical protein